jgi:UDP-N-acetylglucosamine:LPS N-acetylglucosamine transferase
MLGLGQELSVSALAQEITRLIDDFQLRKELHENAKKSTANRRNKRIVSEILNRVFS